VLVLCGVTTPNVLLLVSVPREVVTVTRPVVSPLGMVAVRYVSETTVKLAELPLKETAAVPLNPCPSSPMVSPELAEESGGKNLTNGSNPIFRLYTSPRNFVPPS
jgi:hypothetical protein